MTDIEVNVDEWREQFPNPEALGYDEKGESDYCVGGVFIFQCCPSYQDLENIEELEYKKRFPDGHYLSVGLRQVNPALPREKADWKANLILMANDSGHFDKAWKHLKDALEWEPGDDE